MPTNNRRTSPLPAGPRRRSDRGSPAAGRAPAVSPASQGHPQHRRTQGDEHRPAHPGRQGPARRGGDRDAQAGADLSDPEGADGAERVHLLRGRARSAAGRVRVPSRARLQLSAGSGRHLRVAVPDPEVRSPDGRHGVGPDPAAEGGRALLRAHQGRGGQLRVSGSGARQDLLREPHAALSARARAARDGRQQPLGARDGPDDADRQGAARPDRGRPADRQDDAAAEHRAVDRPQPLGGLPHRAAHRRAARGGDRHAALRRRRGHLVHLRRAGAAPRAGGRDGHREGEAARRAPQGRLHPARFDHAPRARLQHGHPAVRQGAVGRGSTRTPSRSPSVSSAPRATSRRAAR